MTKAKILEITLSVMGAGEDGYPNPDMLQIANIVRIKYLEGGFYSHLLAAVEQVMLEKEATP